MRFNELPIGGAFSKAGIDLYIKTGECSFNAVSLIDGKWGIFDYDDVVYQIKARVEFEFVEGEGTKMKLKDYKCKKCGCEQFRFVERTPHIGAYCMNCGFFLKWLDKREKRLLALNQNEGEVNEISD